MHKYKDGEGGELRLSWTRKERSESPAPRPGTGSDMREKVMTERECCDKCVTLDGDGWNWKKGQICFFVSSKEIIPDEIPLPPGFSVYPIVSIKTVTSPSSI